MPSIRDLEGKVVGITRSYPYASELLENPSITFDTTSTDEQNARKLIAGRIDAFVVEETTGLQAFKLIGCLDRIHYNSETPIAKLHAYYAFHPTEKGYILEKMFSDTIRDMKENGTFATIINRASGVNPDQIVDE